MAATRSSLPFGLSTTRSVAFFVEKSARSKVASSPEAASPKTIRRCSTPATELFSVSDEPTVHSPPPAARERTRIAAVSENLAAMFLQRRDETRVLPHRIPERIDLHRCDRDLRRPRQQAVQDLDRLVVFADDHVNFRQPLGADRPIKRIRAFG